MSSITWYIAYYTHMWALTTDATTCVEFMHQIKCRMSSFYCHTYNECIYDIPYVCMYVYKLQPK